MRYIYSLWLQTASTALVNAQGTIAQRLARWVLMATDRMHAGEIHVTHETIAFLIGVRRASVTLVMHDFETEGLISTGRGHIRIANREALVEASGGFYVRSDNVPVPLSCN